MTELLTGLNKLKTDEIKETSSLQKHLKEIDRLRRSTEEHASSETFDSSFSTPTGKSVSARGDAASSRTPGTVLDSLFSSPTSDESPQIARENKRIRALRAATEWAENIKPRAQHTSFSGRLQSQTTPKVQQQTAPTRVKSHLNQEQLQKFIAACSLRDQSEQMNESQIPVSKMTGISQGKKLNKIKMSREVK